MKIAILGAGFAGLSLAWHLLHQSKLSIAVDLYDPLPIGSGVSGSSSGLLHAFSGLHAKRAWEADIAMHMAHILITAASKAIASPLILSQGILRPACSSEQKEDFLLAAKKYPKEVEWWNPSQCLSKIPSLHFGALKEEGGGLYVRDAVTLNTKLYLDGLWQAVAKSGGRLIAEEVTALNTLEEYNHIVLCLGGGAVDLLGEILPIRALKGQLLKFKWPQDVPPLPCSLVGKGYLVMSEDQKHCYAGATFEREFESEKPNLEVAKPLILEKITPFFP